MFLAIDKVVMYPTFLQQIALPLNRGQTGVKLTGQSTGLTEKRSYPTLPLSQTFLKKSVTEWLVYPDMVPESPNMAQEAYHMVPEATNMALKTLTL